MSEQITLTLPTAVYQQAEALARDAGRPVADVLVETIERSLCPPETAGQSPRAAQRSETAPPAESTDADQEPLQWTWSKTRQKIRKAVREFSEQLHGDY